MEPVIKITDKDFMSQIYCEFIEPYVQPVDGYCGSLFHQLYTKFPNTFYPDNPPPPNIHKLYLDPTVFMYLTSRLSCKENHEPWKACLELFSMIHDGVYEAFISDYSFNEILPTVMRRKLNLRKGVNRDKAINNILSQLRRITYLQIYSAPYITPFYFLKGIDEEDAIQLGVAKTLGCDGFVTYDCHFLGLCNRHNPRIPIIYVPEQLVPKLHI